MRTTKICICTIQVCFINIRTSGLQTVEHAIKFLLIFTHLILGQQVTFYNTDKKYAFAHMRLGVTHLFEACFKLCRILLCESANK